MEIKKLNIQPHGNLKIVFSFIAVITGFFMALLDTTIVNISLPKMAEYFNTDIQTISWVTNSYNIIFIVLMLTGSRIADQFGRKKLFIAGLVIFTTSSFLIGFATTLPWVITFRFIQGISAALVVPVTLPLILNIISEKKIGMVVGIWGAIGGLAAACGPALGGMLSHYYNWQSVFFVNLPLGCIAIILSFFLLQESYDKTASHHIDIPGIISISIAIFALTVGLLLATQLGWNSLLIMGLLSVSLVATNLFIIAEQKSKDPMLPLALFKSLPFCASSITLVFGTMGLMAGSFMIAFFLVKVMGMSQIEAGMTITAMPLSMMVISIIAGPVSQKFGSRIPGILGVSLIALANFLFSTVEKDLTRWDMVWRLIILGAGVGMTISPVMAGTIKLVPPEKVGIASGVTNFARTFGMVVGITILTTAFSEKYKDEFATTSLKMLSSINASTVIDADTKKIVSDELKTLKFTKTNMTFDVNQFLKEIKRKKNEIMMNNHITKTENTIDNEASALQSLLVNAQSDMNDNIFISFKKTFEFYSQLFLLGILISFFIEPFKKNKEEYYF